MAQDAGVAAIWRTWAGDRIGAPAKPGGLRECAGPGTEVVVAAG